MENGNQLDNRLTHLPFSALTLLVGQQEGHLACKNCLLVCWWCHFDWSFARLIAPVVTTTSIVQTNSRMETFWYRLTEVHLENGH